MKVYCPSCSAKVPAAGVQLDKGWAKCVACDEVFPLVAVLPNFPTNGEADVPPVRPFNARAVVERSPGELIIHVPPMGMRAAAWGLLGFALFWLAFIAFWTAGALGVFANANGAPRPANVVFACFSIPFWVVGIGMVASVAWMARGTKSAQITEETMLTQTRCLWWRKITQVERDRIQHARQVETTNKSGPTYGAEIIYEKGSYLLPADTKEEAEWLTGEVNSFLKSLQRVNGRI